MYVLRKVIYESISVHEMYGSFEGLSVACKEILNPAAL